MLLADQAYEEIKRRIMNLELEPGEFLTVEKICALTGIGRTPVHQAIRKLHDERFLEVMPRKGVIVRSDSLHQILEVLEARQAIEPSVASLAAEHISEEELDGLRRLLAQAGAVGEGEGRRQQMEIDREFHGLIAAGSRNTVLKDLIEPLHERSGRLWYLRLRRADDVAQTMREHEAIYAAIRDGDQRGAFEAMTTHLDSLRKRRFGDLGTP